MNKYELARRLVKSTASTNNDALTFLNAFIDVVGRELKNNNKVTLAGFGTFRTVSKKQKKGRNPRTGAVIVIPQRKTVKFLPAKGLKERCGDSGQADLVVEPEEIVFRGVRDTDSPKEYGIRPHGSGELLEYGPEDDPQECEIGFHGTGGGPGGKKK
jgi:DNA-binding protein HU-beta